MMFWKEHESQEQILLGEIDYVTLLQTVHIVITALWRIK
jgi:hypothetical protein